LAAAVFSWRFHCVALAASLSCTACVLAAYMYQETPAQANPPPLRINNIASVPGVPSRPHAGNTCLPAAGAVRHHAARLCAPGTPPLLEVEHHPPPISLSPSSAGTAPLSASPPDLVFSFANVEQSLSIRFWALGGCPVQGGPERPSRSRLAENLTNHDVIDARQPLAQWTRAPSGTNDPSRPHESTPGRRRATLRQARQGR
jgi:hypothetical protein